ncbi:MAG: ATP-binding protein [Patescibacteria group bacterium]|nr:ATP-binding protein [Patescibacteria group bacterium]
MQFKESENLELKKSTSELKEAIIAIAAILNKHQKGKLYFGIKNNGDVVGQEVSEQTIRNISKSISSHIEPKIYPKINKAVINKKNCIKIEFYGDEIPYYAKGRAYIRVGDENKQLSAKELEKMILTKNQNKLQWDKQDCKHFLLKDISAKTVKNFISLAKKSNRLNIEQENNKSVFKKIDLMNANKFNNAAALVFGRNPTNFFHNITVKCGRFKNEENNEFLDIKDLDGNLFEVLDKAMDFFKDHLHVRAKIEGLYRKESYELPLEALREAILNALIHRDYKVNSFVYIKIYDDSIIISNPGMLMDGLKIKDLFKSHESKLRNPLIAKVFYLSGLIDTWGNGVLNIIKLLKNNNSALPEFEQSGDFFRIIFKREKITQKTVEKAVEKTVERMIVLIKENNNITQAELSKKTGLSRRGVEWNLKQLKQKGLLKRIGADRGGHWEIIS